MHSDGHDITRPTGEVLGADAGGTTEKDPEDWVTGDEPMTGAQRSYLDTLARDAGETLSADLTKAEASEHIERLQQETGRGTST
ncbi:transposase [Aeromicrobium sp. Leaf289]|nr:transposase [Aeromicrobium sp. Leaf272]KQP76016.1 transposase [Aeromicrobium sp. Leaf289]